MALRELDERGVTMSGAPNLFDAPMFEARLLDLYRAVRADQARERQG